MNNENLANTKINQPKIQCNLDNLKNWYKAFLFPYAKLARIEDFGSITKEENDALLVNHDFSLAREIIKNRYEMYLTQRPEDFPLDEHKQLTIQREIELAHQTLSPIIKDLDFIIQYG